MVSDKAKTENISKEEIELLNKKLNAITEVLVYDSYHTEKLLDSSILQSIKLN